MKTWIVKSTLIGLSCLMLPADSSDLFTKGSGAVGQGTLRGLKPILPSTEAQYQEAVGVPSGRSSEQAWDAYYSSKGEGQVVHPDEKTDLLRQVDPCLKKLAQEQSFEIDEALVAPSETGENAVFLAIQGVLHIDGVEISKVAVDRATELAKQFQVDHRLQLEQGSLRNFFISPHSYDFLFTRGYYRESVLHELLLGLRKDKSRSSKAIKALLVYSLSERSMGLLESNQITIISPELKGRSLNELLDYSAHHPEVPESFKVDSDQIRKIIHGMGFQVMRVDHYASLEKGVFGCFLVQ